jgi:hypothetical protein
MRTTLNRIRHFYGASPLHLLALIACFAMAGYAAVHTAETTDWPLILLWFLGAVVGHDLILFPLYALADHSIHSAVGAISGRLSPPRPGVSPLNYIRTPALGAALTFLLFFPGIVRQGQDTYLAATGQTQQPYLARWLLLVAVMFGLSTIAYAVRLALHGSRDGVPTKG